MPPTTDANNHTTSYSYDDLNRRLTMTDPLGNQTQYSYDPVGNRTTLTDANGTLTTYGYDAVNRLVSLDYSDSTPAVTLSYNQVGQRLTMVDGTGTTRYSYDDLYRLTEVTNGAGQQIGYNYDPVGNRTGLTYPDNRTVSYSYDHGNRLQTVTDWDNGQFGYTYDDANRLDGLTLPNGLSSDYDYDDAGRLTLLSHKSLTETLASYAYSLDGVGNRDVLTETLRIPEPVIIGAYQEANGQVVIEAENAAQVTNGGPHAWTIKTTQPGFTGTSYLHSLPDLDVTIQDDERATSPSLQYPIHFTNAGTYTVWLRHSRNNHDP